ncbi:phage terminase small subunit P27 family [Priestia aryabhattai]|uniref:phage terminase small subunit P27 family n=1 Tax=Priestia aryabhattai TaxID=412384 RepID=UPI0027E4A952|nr:phage terminase small subunit P27 family [Priestia aryabhattai]
MGRNPKPLQLHLVEGNPNRKTKADLERMEEAEKKVTFKSDSIKPPTWLDKQGKQTFKKLVKEFEETELLFNVDVYNLAMFADAYSLYIECTKEIAREGLMVEYTNKGAETNKVPHPLLTKKKQAFEQMTKIMSEFGLSPVARTKLILNLQIEEDKKPKNRFSDRV